QSELTDLDMVEAISRFQTQQLAYQAGLSSYAQVQRLSLFQYLA
ncbi:MAG: flagellin, partial [Tepidimonas sp.]